MGLAGGYQSSFPLLPPTEGRRGRRAQTELSALFLQTACQDADQEEDEDQVRATGANWDQAAQLVSMGRGGQCAWLGLGVRGLLKDW